jgi:hypothetical protein
MMTAKVAPVGIERADAEQNGGPSGQSAGEMGAFLVAMAKVLHETVARFEETVARITEIAVTRTGRTDRDLVIALQEFDRLQQEFVTFGEVLTRVAAKPSGVWAGETGADQLGHEAIIAAISIAELKGRLLHHLKNNTADAAPSETAEEMIF